jgi:acid stress-induced BolA-like protein IbaG/YrbA
LTFCGFYSGELKILLAPPHHGLIVHLQEEVRENLEEVLPQQERHIEGQAAYIQLAALASEGHPAEALEPVQQVLAQTPVQAGVRGTLINVFFTP